MARDIHPDEVQMSLGEHLEELRKRLILILVGVGIAACVMLVFSRWLIYVICLPLFDTQQVLNLQGKINTLNPATGFMIYLKVSLIAGLVISLPWVLYQIWMFVVYGLYQSEKRVVLILIPFSALMTILAVLFMYFVMLPVCLWFFLSFTLGYPNLEHHEPGWFSRFIAQEPVVVMTDPALKDGTKKDHGFSPNGQRAEPTLPVLRQDPDQPEEGEMWLKQPENEVRFHVNEQNHAVGLSTRNMMNPLIEIGQYLGLVTTLLIGVIVAFQTPVVMLVLGWTGLVNPSWFSRYRRHCIFLCFLLGAFLTPADLPSMFMLALPLWGLFEFGIILMRLVQRKRRESQGT